MPSEPTLKPTMRPPEDLLWKAAQFRWANPGATWDQVAKHVGRSRKQMLRWRMGPRWREVFMEVGAEYVELLVPAAVRALPKQWSKGNAAGAIDVLRSYGFLQPAQLNVNVDSSMAALQQVLLELAPDVRVQVAAALDRLGGETPVLPSLPMPTVIDALPPEMTPPTEVEVQPYFGLDEAEE